MNIIVETPEGQHTDQVPACQVEVAGQSFTLEDNDGNLSILKDNKEIWSSISSRSS